MIRPDFQAKDHKELNRNLQKRILAKLIFSGNADLLVDLS